MKKLVLKTLLFSVLLSLVLVGVLILSAKEPYKKLISVATNSTEYGSGYNQGACEIIPYIYKVQTKDAYTKLILGDSVCFRMFSELQDLNKDYCIAGTNRGVTMAGQYILAEQFLENHPDATEIYLVVIEDSLLTDFETGYGYQYAVMPFIETDTFTGIEADTLHDLKSVYGSFFLNKEMVMLIEHSDLNKKLYYNLLNKVNPKFSTLEIPDVSITYIEKMYRLCEEKGVTLYLVPEPLKDVEERRELEAQIRTSYETSPLYELFPDYFEQLQYLPPDMFADNVHIAGTREELNDVIRIMQKNSNCMKDLILEPQN